MKRTDGIKLILSLALCAGAGVIGSQYTVSAIPVWYAGLVKPWFTPPAWLFGPVWTALYLLMGVALYSVWIKGSKKKEKGEAIQLFFIQLIFNAAWSLIFFGLHNIFAALVEIVILWLLITETTLAFYKIDRSAGKLLLPYLIWVSFAAVLNFAIWQMNF